MPFQFTQAAFTAGEWGRNSHARTDLERYGIAAKVIENMIVHVMGGVSTRPGFGFIKPAKHNDKTARLIAFQYNDEDQYALEFGDQYMRVFRNGGQVLFTYGPNIGDPFELATPWTEADLPLIKFTQSANVLTITHPDHPVYDITRTAHDNWTVTENAFGPQITYPTGGAGTAVTAGSAQTYRYRITAENADGSEESIVGLGLVKTITGITKANPAVVTATSHTFSNGDEVEISGVVGMTELNGTRAIVANVTANTFELLGVDSTGYTTYVSGGEAARLGVVVTSGAVLSSTNFVTLTWNAVTGASKYNIYKEKSGIYGYIASAVGLTAKDDNINPEMDDTPPTTKEIFTGAGMYPGTIGYHDERRVFGYTRNDPIGFWTSQVGNYYNLNVSEPLRADDAISGRLTARKVNAIRHILSLQDLILLTSGGVWRATTQDGFLSASNPPRMRWQSGQGSSHLTPLEVGSMVLFVQSSDKTGIGGKIIRELGYSFDSDTYSGADINVLARHRANGRKIMEMAFCEEPDGIVWCVLDDGTAAAMTYSAEYKVTAWHSHNTQGSFESFCSLSEDGEDYLYAIVKRTVNGSTVRYVERMASRQWTDLRDAFCVDSGLTYDGFLDDTLTLSDATVGTGRTLTGTGAKFTAGMVGSKIYYGFDGANGKATITGYTSTNVITVTVDKAFTSTTLASGDWAVAVNTLSGLEHLEGEEVVIFADKRVQPTATVDTGAIALQNYVCKAHVGLGYTCKLQPLDFETSTRAGTTVGKKKSITAANVNLTRSRGVQIGPDYDHLTLIKQKSASNLSPIDPMEGVFNHGIDAEWSSSGAICLAVTDPVPATILSITPEVTISV